MSGGHFSFKQHHIGEIADEIECRIYENGNVKDRYGNVKNRFRNKTIKRFREGVKYLRIAQIYAQRIDWLLSYDDSEDSFHDRLKSDLKEIK